MVITDNLKFILRGVAISALCLEIIAQLLFSLPAIPEPVVSVAAEPVWQVVYPADIPVCMFSEISNSIPQSHSSGWWCVVHNNNVMDVR